jgi:PAS domain S-box-containing protein
MRFRPQRSVIVLVLSAGIILAATSLAQIAHDASPDSETRAASPPTPEVGLSRKNVLILHGLESNVHNNVLTDRGIQTVLESGGVSTRNQFFEFLDLARNPGPEHRILMRQLMRRRYSRRRIDLVITMYPEALLFALNESYTMFPGAPIVALYLPVGFEWPHAHCRVIPQFVTPDISGTLELALRLVPKAKRVYVVSGSHSLDRWLERKARLDFEKWRSLLEFRYLSGMPLRRILTTVSQAPARSIVLVTAFQEDVTGEIFTSIEVGEKLSRISKAPVFGLLGTMLGRGIVGGSLISFEYIGTKAAELGLDILREARGSKNIPAVLNVPYLPKFDWKQLRHWGLSAADLPATSIVINREPTFWDFKYHIGAALVFIIGQSLLISVLLAQRRRRRRAEETLGQKKEELDRFFSVTLDLLCIAGTDGHFLRLNPAWEKTLGYSLAELTSRPFLDFVHPDDMAATRDAIQKLSNQGHVLDFSNRYRCKNGAYRRMLWSAAASGGLIYAAARDVTARFEAEAALQERERELQSLTGRLILGQEAERRRVARELHDDLSQRLAALAIEVGKTETCVNDGQDPILKNLRGLRDQTIRIAADVHNLSRLLHPSILEDLGLKKAVESECGRFSAQEGIEVTFTAEKIPEALSKDVSLSIYRIVQESLNNIAKHACARRVKIALQGTAGNLCLFIQDDGVGFDATEVRQKQGLGLSSMRERVRIIQGVLQITSEPEKGTTITVHVALEKSGRTEVTSTDSE